jgi:hypothetical protein
MERKHDNRPWIIRPQGAGFGFDVVSGLAVLVGSALAALVFDTWDGFVGTIVGVVIVVLVRAVLRRMKR